MKEERVMRDTEPYQNLLGIVFPWTVDSVTMDVEKQRVDVTVSHPPKMLFACPECGAESPVFDQAEERAWRHLDSCQFFTYLHARVPRIACATHGVRQVSVPPGPKPGDGSPTAANRFGHPGLTQIWNSPEFPGRFTAKNEG